MSEFLKSRVGLLNERFSSKFLLGPRCSEESQEGVEAPSLLKQALHKTGLMPVGLKGTSHAAPQLVHVAGCIADEDPPRLNPPPPPPKLFLGPLGAPDLLSLNDFIVFSPSYIVTISPAVRNHKDEVYQKWVIVSLEKITDFFHDVFVQAAHIFRTKPCLCHSLFLEVV